MLINMWVGSFTLRCIDNERMHGFGSHQTDDQWWAFTTFCTM